MRRLMPQKDLMLIQAPRPSLLIPCGLAQVSADNFDGVFYPGGHGPLWDLAVDSDSIALIERFMQQGKPVAAVCHAPAVLVNASAADGGALVKGLNVTGFSNSEEAAVGLTEIVPFLLEDRLQAMGAHYTAGEDWAPARSCRWFAYYRAETRVHRRLRPIICLRRSMESKLYPRS